MSVCESAFATGIASLGLIFTALFISTAQTQHPRYDAIAKVQNEPYDNDIVLEFHWAAASGNVSYYNVYLSVKEKEDEEWGSWCSVGQTDRTPTPQDPYIVPRWRTNPETGKKDQLVGIEAGRKYRLRVQAVAADDTTGPMSEPSDPVLCVPGDIDRDLRVGPGDKEILSKAWRTQPGDASFDHRADLNGDGSVNLLDLIIIVVNSGWFQPDN